MSIVRSLRAALGPHLLTPIRAFTTSARPFGLEEFFAEPVKEGEKVTAGEEMYPHCSVLCRVVTAWLHMIRLGVSSVERF